MQICSFSWGENKTKALAMQGPTPTLVAGQQFPFPFSSWSVVSPFLIQPTCLYL